MSQFDHIDDQLLTAAPKTNRVFLLLMLAGLISFLATIGLFTYTVVHNREIAQDICEDSNESRSVLTALVLQGQEEQIIAGELRDPSAPSKPGQKIIFYVPENPNKDRTAKALSIVKQIDCKTDSGGGGL